MSDWVIDNSNQKMDAPNSDWVVDQEETKQPKESLGFSALMAAPRVGEDVLKGVANFASSIPGYLESAKTAIPQAFQTIKEHPDIAAKQASAGLSELGQNTFNAPHNLINYLTNRLNLFPEDINKKIQMGRMPEDTGQMINQSFGKPQNQGEELLRGIPRNAEAILGAKGVVSALNPMRYTYSNIMKNVVGTRNALQNRYGRTYNNIFNHAELNGLGANLSDLIPHLDLGTAMMNEPGHALRSIQEFIENPTTRTAHEAKRDMLKVQRKLNAKNERDTLTGGERNQLNALNRAIPDIENNMFTDANGIPNVRAETRYRNTSRGYATEVVPYTKNKAINEFRKGDKLPKETVQSLSRGKFAARRGSFHPEIGRRNFLNHISPWAAGGVAGGATLYSINQLLKMLRDNPTNLNQ